VMKNIPQEPELLNLESNNIPIIKGFLTLIYENISYHELCLVIIALWLFL
jgi:RecG-like helicase